MIETLDVRTLAVVGGLVFLSVTGVMTLVYLNQRVYTGFRLWLAWQAAVTAGVLVFAFRGPDPGPWLLLLTNLLLLSAPAMLFDGLTRFHGLYATRGPALSNYALVAAALLLQVWFCFVEPDANNRIAVFSTVRAVIQLRCAVEPLRMPSARRSAAFWLLSAIMVAMSVSELHHAWLGLQPEPIVDLRDSLNVKVSLIFAVFADVLAAYGLVLLTNERVESELHAAHRDIEVLARTDSLTGLWNRRHFEDTLESEIVRAQRYGTPLSLLALDADHFKRVNDELGHHAGDAVLREIAQLIGTRIRRSDVLCRWGGEEFLVLVPGTGLRQAAVMAEKIRQAVAAHVVAQVGAVTVSIGVGELLPGETAETWLRRVDAALYDAKQQGRNRVTVSDPATVAAAAG